MSELIKTRSKSSAVQSARVERVVEVSIDKQLKNIEKNFTYLATLDLQLLLLDCSGQFGE